MRIFCINSDGWETKRFFLWGLISFRRETNGPRYGDISTVTDEEFDKGKVFYALLEWPGDQFESECFIPLSEDEEESECSEINEQLSIG